MMHTAGTFISFLQSVRVGGWDRLRKEQRKTLDQRDTGTQKSRSEKATSAWLRKNRWLRKGVTERNRNGRRQRKEPKKTFLTRRTHRNREVQDKAEGIGRENSPTASGEDIKGSGNLTSLDAALFCRYAVSVLVRRRRTNPTRNDGMQPEPNPNQKSRWLGCALGVFVLRYKVETAPESASRGEK